MSFFHNLAGAAATTPYLRLGYLVDVKQAVTNVATLPLTGINLNKIRGSLSLDLGFPRLSVHVEYLALGLVFKISQTTS